MAKTYTMVMQRIASLQKEADSLKAEEVAGVIARIREAVQHYDLTPDQIFGAQQKPRVSTKPPASSKEKKAVPPRRSNRVAKFRDEHGNEWGGRGPRPAWFKAALEAGKSEKDLLIAA